MNTKKRKLRTAISLLLCIMIFAGVLCGCEDEKDEKQGTSSKKDILMQSVETKNGDEGDGQGDSTGDGQEDGNTEEKTIEDILFENQDGLHMIIVKAAIDCIMQEGSYDGNMDYNYWSGIQKAVARLYHYDDFAGNEITIDEYGGMKWYKVDGLLVEEIGKAMFNDIVKSDVASDAVMYKEDTNTYYFNITEVEDYRFESTSGFYAFYDHFDFEGSEENQENLKSFYGCTTVSKWDPEAYAAKYYKFDVVYPSDNMFGFSIVEITEKAGEPYMSTYQRGYDGEEEMMEQEVVSVGSSADSIIQPYVWCQIKYEDENESMWRTVYHAMANYCSDWGFGDDSATVVEKDAKKYLEVNAEKIEELKKVYLWEGKLSYESIPNNMKELIQYDENTNMYTFEIDYDYIVESYYGGAYEKVGEYEYTMYGSIEFDSDDKEYMYKVTVKSDKNNSFGFTIVDFVR